MKKQSNKGWLPSPEIKRHDGSPIPDSIMFFGAPPPEIGKVITADSSLKTGSRLLSRLEITGIATAIGLGAALFLLWGVSLSGSSVPTLFFVGTGIFVAAIAFVSLSSEKHCSFVGELGIAEFTLTGSSLAKPKAQILNFHHASNLYTKVFRKYTNYVYQRTEYIYQWKCKEREVFGIRDVFRSEPSTPKSGDRWYFAKAAETAWTKWLLKTANDNLEQLGYVEF
ncbi:MAG: hypothetical protein AAFW75_30840, partial [Cyanobacteria bacterium J06636_16]